MGEHCRSKRFDTIRRHLSLYNFKREKNSNRNPVFQHPYFRRGEFDLLQKIQRSKQPRKNQDVKLRQDLLDSCFKKITKEENCFKSENYNVNSENDSEEDQENHVSKRDCLRLIYDLESYKGKGIAAFFRKFIPQIKKVFPQVFNKISNEINNTDNIICQTNSLEQPLDANSKEHLIKLINTILFEINNLSIKKETGSRLEDFNNSLSPLDMSHLSFNKERNIGKRKKTPLVFDEKKSPLLVTPLSDHHSIHLSNRSISEGFGSCFEEA